MTGRLPSAVIVTALLRRIQTEGGAGTVIARGDADRGDIVLLLAERGQPVGQRERRLQADGQYGWVSAGPGASQHERYDSEGEERTAWLARRRQRDPDLWLVELDIAGVQRLVDETAAID